MFVLGIEARNQLYKDLKKKGQLFQVIKSTRNKEFPKVDKEIWFMPHSRHKDCPVLQVYFVYTCQKNVDNGVDHKTVEAIERIVPEGAFSGEVPMCYLEYIYSDIKNMIKYPFASIQGEKAYEDVFNNRERYLYDLDYLASVVAGILSKISEDDKVALTANVKAQYKKYEKALQKIIDLSNGAQHSPEELEKANADFIDILEYICKDYYNKVYRNFASAQIRAERTYLAYE